MTSTSTLPDETLLHALALAARLEGEGYYNIGKLLRAAVDSLLRQAAYPLEIPSDHDGLGREIGQALAGLQQAGVDAGLLDALRRGREALAAGRLVRFDETPDPFVCRTCGHVSLAPPQDICPVCGAWPGTFQRFPGTYWLHSLDPFQALAGLRYALDETGRLIAGLDEAALDRQPADGSWSIRQVLSHLRDAQGLLAGRVERILEQENPSLAGAAVFEWTSAGGAEDTPPTTRAIFEDYRRSREGMITRLERLPLADWWRTGQHEEFGPVTLCQQASYFALHDLTHLPQIAALRRDAAGA